MLRDELFDALYRLSLRAAARRLELTSDEAHALIDACLGLELEPRSLGQNLRAEVQDYVAHGRHEQWRIDGPGLVRRLRELPTPLTAALEIWQADYWTTPDRDAHVRMVLL